ncbi:alpha-glucuronidase [candidate division KSB1 bacterium]|nr:alpha-glucuronidase [candidate division KSB1 bacterium]
MKTLILAFIFLFVLSTAHALRAEGGYRLWLKYDLISNPQKLQSYQQAIRGWMIIGDCPILTAAKKELQTGLEGLLGSTAPFSDELKNGLVIAGTYKDAPLLAKANLGDKLKNLGPEGFVIVNTTITDKKVIVITANADAGVLYGVFHFLRLLQTQQNLEPLDLVSFPKIRLRLLNHWDNLDRTVERGYAGFSLWDWHKLPDYIHSYYHDYARANASIGINGTVLNNVNANALILTPLYLEKVAALAEVFRPYNIKVYLSIRFSAPIDIGGLKVSDPLDKQVRQWWKAKAGEIYALIPDFGGFLVKANSEGQPGPQNYGRTHADGANMLADALQPFGGVVMWRAFVYDDNIKEDRAKQAYNEFKPLDGAFGENVLVQVKNGPIDFQPREPFHPLFGATPKTSLMVEFQITQEYLGFSTHLVYLGTLFKEVLDADTYARGAGSTVAKIVDGSLDKHTISGIAGVANTGTDRNWTGHLFAQANWYAFGRLAWDHQLTAEAIAEEWIRMTLSNDPTVIQPVKKMMMASRENTVNYMSPLGLHHIMGWGHHYGPAPWIKDKHRDDWTSVYYHKADSSGVGFDRTARGSNAVSQYCPPVAKKFTALETCPDEYLLWFHHLSWDYKMRSGKTLWEELCHRYYAGAAAVQEMQNTWNALQGKIDEDSFRHVQAMLKIQEKEAVWWRNACVLYFQSFSRRPMPAELEKPQKSLQYYQELSFPFAPK